MGMKIDIDDFRERYLFHAELKAIEEFNQIIHEIKKYDTPKAIPKADYENRLKADIMAMLEELKEQLREMHEDFFETEHFDEAYGVSDSMDIIQEKIDALRGEEK